MGKTSDQRSAFDGRRRLTLLGMCNQCGEIFRFSVFAFGDVVCSLQSAGSGDVDTVFVRSVGTRRNDAVTGKQDRSVETFKLFFLFPPGISVVSCQMLVFFQLGLIMCGEHFTVSVNVYTCSFGLFQQFFEVFQIMAADKDTGIIADT